MLGLIVLIRTFLSLALQLELEGRWPWQRPGMTASPDGKPAEDGRPCPRATGA